MRNVIRWDDEENRCVANNLPPGSFAEIYYEGVDSWVASCEVNGMGFRLTYKTKEVAKRQLSKKIRSMMRNKSLHSRNGNYY